VGAEAGRRRGGRCRLPLCGRNLLALGLDEAEVRTFLAFQGDDEEGGAHCRYFPPAAEIRAVGRVAPADVPQPCPVRDPAGVGRADVLGERRACKARDANVVLLPVPPWIVSRWRGGARVAERAGGPIAALRSNWRGCWRTWEWLPPRRWYARFKSPVTAAEKRWLDASISIGPRSGDDPTFLPLVAVGWADQENCKVATAIIVGWDQRAVGQVFQPDRTSGWKA